MSTIQQRVTFEKLGLNTDDNYTFIENGSSPFNMNIMVGEDGSQGIVSNAKGNLQIVYPKPLILSRCYMVLGSFYNYLQRACYYFIFSQPYLDSSDNTYKYDNRLVRYNEDTQTIDDIFYDTHNYMGLDPAQHLTDIKMIESWLFFNPVTDEPKMIDVEMAYNYTNYPAWDDEDESASAQLGSVFTWKGGLFVANTTIAAGEDPSTATDKWDRIGNSYQDESTTSGTDLSRAFFAIKIPPIDRIVPTYGNDATVDFNNVDKTMFRFCHRYQYFDNSYSVCSAHSIVTRPQDTELYNGEGGNVKTSNNYIKLSFALSSPALVKNIEIFFQEIGGDWKRAAIINRQSQALLDDVKYTYNFYNNESYPLAPLVNATTSVADIPYDAVPRRAASQEIINKNILCYAGCTEGFNNLDKDTIDVTLTPVIHEIPSTTYEGVHGRNNVDDGDVLYMQEVDYDANSDISEYIYTVAIDVSKWYGDSTPSEGDVYKVEIEGNVNYRVLTSTDVASAGALADAMVATIGMGAWKVAIETLVEVLIQRFHIPITIDVSKFYTPTEESATTTLPKIGGFKTQAYHPFCLFYYDEALRRGDSQVSSDLKVYVPSINDYSPPVTTTNHRWSIDWAINHTAPTWAKYWKFGYAGNTKCGKNFIQYIVSSILNGDPSTGVDGVLNSVRVSILPLQTIRTTTETGWNTMPNSTIPMYEFNPGDRIRFMTEGVTDVSVTGARLGNAVDRIYDFEIIKFDSKLSFIYVQDFDYTTAKFGQNTLVEIYTPNKGDSLLTYYEFGDFMPVFRDGNGNSIHGGQSQDQVIGLQPATGSFVQGDVYHILRTPSKPFCTFDETQKKAGMFHETNAWSDFYKSDEWDKGKLGIESPIGEVELNIIRFSDPYLQNTSINSITTFKADNYKELNDTYGKITSIVEVGDTLKCYQEKKASSIQIGRTSYYNADGESTNVQTQSFILGTIRYSPNNYGTIFPESVSKNNRYVYFFDIYNGVFCRDSPAGVFPISGRYADIGASVDYKMQTYFKKKSKELLASGVGHCHVMTVWDEEYKMLYVLFKDTVNNANNEAVVFHEPSDRWITSTNQFEYTPLEPYNQLLELEYSVVRGFENGIGYEFDEESRFAVFNIGRGKGTSAKVNLTPREIKNSIFMGVPSVSITLPPVIKNATEVTGSSFIVNWNASEGATGYYLGVALDYDAVTGVGFTNFVAGYEKKDVGNVLSYTVTGLSNNTYYPYQLRAYNSTGETIPSISSQRTSNPPANVIATAATSVTLTSFIANWNAATMASGYYLDVALDSGFTNFIAGFNNRYLDGNTLSYAVIRLNPNTVYYYRVRAVNLKGQLSIAYSNVITVTTLLPSPVILGPSSVTATSFSANWERVTGATGYKLDVSKVIDFSSFLPGFDRLDVSNANTYPLSGLSSGVIHYYRVRAYNSTQTSEPSDHMMVLIKDPPSIPNATAATGISTTSFVANWDAGINAWGYYLDYALDINFTLGLKTRDITRDMYNLGQTSVMNLQINTTYFYRVRAYGYSGVEKMVSDYSIVIALTTANEEPSSIPVATGATEITTSSFVANWNQVVGTPSYYLYVSESETFNSFVYGFAGLDVGTATAYNVTGLMPGQTYYYCVRSHNRVGTSDNSNVKSVTTAGVATPTITLSESEYNYAYDPGYRKTILVTITNALSWDVLFPSLNGFILGTNVTESSIDLYYIGDEGTTDSVQFIALGAGGTSDITTFTAYSIS